MLKWLLKVSFVVSSRWWHWSRVICKRGSQSVVPGPAAAAWPGRLLEMQILGPHSGPSEWGALQEGPANWVLTSSLGDSKAHSSLRISVWKGSLDTTFTSCRWSCDILDGESTQWVVFLQPLKYWTSKTWPWWVTGMNIDWLCKMSVERLPVVVQWKRILLVPMRMQVQFLASLSGSGIWCCCGYGGSAAAALIQLLAWELP